MILLLLQPEVFCEKNIYCMYDRLSYVNYVTAYIIFFLIFIYSFIRQMADDKTNKI